ncbi:MAG: amidohydrolase family protein [Bryobacterales bacterium]|nr:amidohydrolase family protein [Bryobacterales bacterium]
MRIDAHQHFWQYTAAEYGWLGDGMEQLRRDFLPDHLRPELLAAEMDGCIAVQARQTLEETVWLLDLADENPWIAGVVGWAPLAADDIGAVLDRLSSQTKLKGLRHVIQSEADPTSLANPQFQRGAGLLAERGWVYDILIFERQLPSAIAFVDKLPNQRFVLDHVAKPRIRESVREPWEANLRELARRPNVWCKVSGMVTEADWSTWRTADLKPYLDAALEAFTPARLLFGSDWPVCLAASTYARWRETVEQWAAPLSAAERARIFGDTAKEVYSL